MKKVALTLIGLGAVVGAAWYLAGSPDEIRGSAPVGTPGDEPPPPSTTVTDATEVFQRAFWKRPTEKDKILHAERQEWADGEGVEKWQWFIEVDPSTELARYLMEQNPFSMGAPQGDVVLPREQVPEWFPETADGFDVKQTVDGQMVFLIRPDDGRLFAASHGRGFAKAVETPPSVPVVQTSGNPGRLPTTPPPKPSDP